MHRTWCTMIIVVMMISCVWVVSSYGIPFELKYQGYIEVGGVPYTGIATTFFSLIDNPSSPTTNYWTNDNSHPSPGTRPFGGVAVTVTNGVFTLNLGDTTLNMYPVYSSVFANDPVYLRFWYKAGSNKTVQGIPDEKMVSVGYALNAVRVNGRGLGHGLNNIPLNDYTLSTGLNADMLDGQHGGFYRNAGNLNAGVLPSERLAGSYSNVSVDYANWAGNASSADNALSASSASNSNQLNGQPGSYYQDAGNLTGTISSDRLIGEYGSVTAGYALDADKLDGMQATDFAKPLYDAIVAPTNGDYTTISDALSTGKKTIFVRNGLYIEPSVNNITQNGVNIIGESRDGVKIVWRSATGFGATGGMYVNGYKGTYTNGSCQVANGSATVTGYDVSWTLNMVGQYIKLGDEYYEISAFGDTSTLTIKSPYYGISTTFTGYKIIGLLTGFRMENLSVVSTAGCINMGVNLNYTKNAVIRNCGFIQTRYTGLYIQNSIESLIEDNIIDDSGSTGCAISHSDHVIFKHNRVTQNIGYGVYFDDADNNTIIGNQICGNRNTGLVINQSNNNSAADNNVRQNGDAGIWLNNNANGNRLTGNVCSSNYTIGICVQESSQNNSMINCSATDNPMIGIYVMTGCTNTIVVGCHAYNNGSNMIDSGTNTQKGYNYAP
ncbi:MAG: right-handed parallel beta-helix repeat-containing protein [bacterium]